MTPSDQYQFISGTFVREVALLGGDVSKLVFPSVERWLKEKAELLKPSLTEAKEKVAILNKSLEKS